MFNNYIGDTLKLDIGERWKLKGFDAVIGNPPYTRGVYKKFTEHSVQIGRLLLFVIPSTFTIGVSHDKFIEYLKNSGLKMVEFLNKNMWNNDINIDTLYLLVERGYNSFLTINGVGIERTEQILNIMDEKYHSILKKINLYKKMELQKGKNKTLNYRSKTETEHIKFVMSQTHPYKLLSRLGGGTIEYFYVDEYQETPIQGIKLLFPRGTASYNSLSNLKNLTKDIVYSKIEMESILLSTGIVYVKCANVNEAIIIQWYLMRSKFVRYLFIKENKFSELTKGFVRLIPQLEWEKISDRKDLSVYNYLGLSNDEIRAIETFI